MANGRERIDIDVGLKIEKTGLTELKSSLQTIQQEAAKASGTDKMTKELESSAQAAKKLEKILDSAWNSKLQQFNLNKVNKEIKTAYGSVNQLKTALEGSGNVGAAAYNKVASALLTTNMQLKQSNKLLDSMAISMANTVKWGITSSIFNNMTRSIQQAWSYTKHLDSSLNDIRIVTGQSAEQMDKFAKSANKAAKELGASTLDYTEASLIYYQQGLDEKEVAARAETTLKAANVTGQSGEEVSEQLTAVWNGYKVSAEEAELYVDKLAAVAATTAADLEELSTGMSKVASAAALMGVPIDSLNAQMATIVSVTRQAPESVGTALKTIYARMGDIEAGLDSETSLGHYTAEMKNMGINVLDTSGQLRDMGDVIAEVGEKWQGMSREQQIALSQTMAGTRQYNNLLALFDNWDMYTDAINTSANAAGTLQKQQDIYMESTAAHLQELRTETQRTYDLMFNTDSINGMIDGVDSVVEHFNNFIEGIDGGGHALLLFGSIAANIFDKQLAGSLLKLQNNLQILKFQVKDAVNTLQGKTNANNAKQEWINTQAAAQVNLNNAVSGTNVGDAGLKAQQQAASEVLKVQKGLTQEQYQQSLEINKQIGLLAQKEADLVEEKRITQEMRDALASMNAKENMSDASIQRRINNKKEELSDLNIEKLALQEISYINTDIEQDIEKAIIARKTSIELEQRFKQILTESSLESDEIDQAWQSLSSRIENGSFEAANFKQYLNEIALKESQVSDEIKEGNSYLRARSPELQREIDQTRQLKQGYVDANKAIVDKGAANVNMQKFVNIGMAAVGTIASLTGAMSVLGDETAGTEQKVHAAGSAFSGVAMAIGSAFGPAGMVIGGIIGALSSLVSQLDFVEDAFKSTQERMQELQEEQSKIISQTNQFNSSKKALQSIAEEYQNLSDKAGDYDKNIENLTSEEVDRYNELKNTILEYNPEALLAYDAEGNAILKKNELIQETINLLKEQYELETLPARKEAHEEKGKLLQKNYEDAEFNLNNAEGALLNYTNPEYGALYHANRNQTDLAVESLEDFINDASESESIDKSEKIFIQLEAELAKWKDGQDIDTEVLTNFINSFKDKVGDSKEIQYMVTAAEDLLGNYEIYAKNKQDAYDAVKAAEIELENAQQIDSAYIIEEIKFNDENWADLEDLNLDIDLNQILAEYAEGLNWEVGKEGDYDPLIQKAQDYIAAVQEAVNNLGVEGFNALVADAQELEIEDFSNIDEYNEALKNKINEIINNNKAFFESIAPEYKQYIFEMLFGLSGVNFNDEGLVSEINAYADKIKEVTNQINTEYKAQNAESGHFATQGLIEDILTPDQLENFSEISKYIDRNIASTEGWKKALLDAILEWEKANNDAEIASEGKDLGFSEEEIEAAQALSEDLLELSKSGEKVNKNLSKYPDLAKEMAKESVRVSKGVKELRDNWDDYSEALKKGVVSADYSKAMEDLKENLEDILDVSEEDAGWLTDDFVADNLEDIKAAANGSQEAIDRLRVAAAEEILINSHIKLPEEDFNELTSLMAQVENEDIQIGASIDDSAYATQLFNMMRDAGYTAKEISDAFNEIGWEPEVEQRTYTLTDEDVRNGSITVPSMVDAETGTVDMQTIPIKSTASVGSTISYTVIKGKNGKSGFTPSMTRKAAASASGGSGSSGGKGGGGGGGGSSKPKTEKKIESKKDRYHDVNVRLEQIDDQLEDIGKDQEKLFGKDLIDSLNEELEILEKQRDTLKEKLDIARQEQAELQHTLRQSGVNFNADGTIANYLSIIEQKEAEYNALVDQYNSLAAGDAQDNFKETVLDPAKENLDKLYEDIQAYDDLILDTIPEIENGLDDITDREVEINIQKMNMEMELRLDLVEARKDWNDFKREVLDNLDDDDLFGNALADKELFEQIWDSEALKAGANELETIIGEINDINETGSSDIFGEDKQAALEELKTSMEDLMGVMEELDALQEAIAEGYLESIDKVADAFDGQVESYEFVNDLVQHNLDMIELLHGDDAYAEMAKSYEQMEKNNLDIVAANKQAVDYYKQMMETETDPEAVKKWEELWTDAVSNLNNSVEESAQTIIDKYTNTINQIFDELNDKLTNGKGLDYVNLEWELSNENQDAYLDAINSEYELQQLERKYRDSIDSADSISAQRSLNKLMDEELKKLREKDKLTQYDIDRANAKYELRLKEIALEEAQQNKTQMRLRRDSSGNYSYQFVADQDSVSAAQQEVDEARNSLYNMDKDAYRENQQAILDVWNEYQEKMRDSANLSAEERALIQQQYEERINGLLEENTAIRLNLTESAMTELTALYDQNAVDFQNMTDAEKQIIWESLIPNWDSGVQQMTDTFIAEGGFLPACQNAFNQLDQATVDYNNSLQLLESTAGTSFGAMAEGYNKNIELAEELAEKQQENIDNCIEEQQKISDLRTEVDNLATSYKAVWDNAAGALKAAQELLTWEQDKAAREADEERIRKEQEQQQQQQGSNEGSSSGGSSGGGSGGSAAVGKKVTFESGIYYNSSDGQRPTGYYKRGQQVYITNMNPGAPYPIHISENNSIGKGYDLGWLKENQLKFDTGGYTGEWTDNEGRMAILHKKELVLNADDTQNFLAAISMVRDMSGIFEAMNDSILSRVTGMTNALTPQAMSSGMEQNELNQNVNIQASFPGVSSRAEIEQAFANLVNMASQHAYNTRR